MFYILQGITLTKTVYFSKTQCYT